MKKLITYCFLSFLLLASVSHLSTAQGDIQAYEYFIDDGDLGVGANTAVAITQGANITESFVVPTSALPVGFHTLHIRVQDLGGVWSMQESRSFYVSASNLTTQANVADVEYFVDTDPGYGNGTSLGPFASATITINPTIPTSALAAGFHVLYVRALDSDGVWGNVESRSFYVSQSNLTTTATIMELRYYIDTDPGKSVV